MSDMQTVEVPRVGSVKRDRPEIKKLSDRNFQQEEFVYARMSATLPVGWTIEDALRPEFWSSVSYKLQGDPMSGRRDYTGSIITVRTADHAFYAELYVRAVQPAGLIVEMIGKPTQFGPEEVKSEKFDVRWNVGRRGFDVVRRSDGEVVAGGDKIKTREAANEWIEKMRA